MSAYNPGESLSHTSRSAPQAAGTESKSASSPEPRSAKIGPAKTEVPKEPETIHHAFEPARPDPLVVGNPKLELALRLDGQLGHFISRASSAAAPTFIELNATAYRQAVQSTLFTAFQRLLHLAGHIEVNDIIALANEASTIIANGVMIMTYLRLRRVNSLELTQMTKFYRKPKAPETLVVPTPYALAISQLGIVRASSLVEEKIFCPTIHQGSAANFCLPQNIHWSTARYLQAVEFGQKIGMRFAPVDLSVPLGSSWWLYRQDDTDHLFSLQCSIPEDNFTEATAVLHSLFCINEQGGFANEIFNLNPIERHDYGAMLRNPHADINVSSYFAIEDAPETVWKVV
nr:coat protein [Camellia cryptic virus 1]UZZ64763.1 coat protein [Camellia cryptic virus 1]UZZ64764.1 coat protein [Camellia cryptic virus 1]